MYLNRLEGVAANTLLPSGDQETNETPPPPYLRSWTQDSIGTFQA